MGRPDAVLDVDRDRTARDERQALLVGGQDLDLELERASSEPTEYADTTAGYQTVGVQIDQFERDRRPPGNRLGLGQQGEHLVG